MVKRFPLQLNLDGSVRVAYDFYKVVDGIPVRFVFGESEHGQFILFRLEIGPNEDETQHPDVKPVTTQTLRAIPVATLVEDHLLQLARGLREGRFGPHAVEVLSDGSRRIAQTAMRDAELDFADSADASAPRSRRPGRPPRYAHAHWQTVADVYKAHGGRAPRKAVAEHFGIDVVKASKWIGKARELGLLTPYVGGDRG